MGKTYVINVVHTEPDWWNGKLRGIDIGIPLFRKIFIYCFLVINKIQYNS